MSENIPSTLHNMLRRTLFSICDHYPQYEPLRDSLGVTRSESSERLSQSNRSFPEYTRHDMKHAENVVAKMEMLIGPDRIALLGPTDIWMLLMCAYTHDWGMVVSLADLREHLQKEDGLGQHIQMMRESHQGIYSEAAHNLDLERLNNQVQEQSEDVRSVIEGLNAQRSLMLVLQSYFRKFHANGYGKNLNNCEFTGISRRLRALVADINATHVNDFKQVMKLPHHTDGFGTDTAHPRFVAMMLRLADLMDIDNGRVNPFQVRLGTNSKESMTHQEKHLAVTMVLTSPKRVGAQFDFKSSSIKKNYQEYGKEILEEPDQCIDESSAIEIRAQAAREAFAWYDMLKVELNDLALHWNDIIPVGYTGSAPTIDDGEFFVTFDGVPVKAKDLDLRYTLSYVRAFEIIRGAGLYRDRLTFIRELVQNAMDATKIQLFQAWEAKNGSLKSDVNINKFFTLLPYKLEEIAIRVEVIISKPPDEKVVLRIRDFGTGISHEKLRQLRFVGNIHDTETDQVKRRMPKWLRPTGSFGIGIQSVFDFLKSRNKDEAAFSMKTRSAKTNDSMEISFRANRSEGEIFYQECGKGEMRPRIGTDVEIPLTEHLDDILVYVGVHGADLFAEKAARVARCIQEYLIGTISHDIIPLRFEIKKSERGFAHEKPFTKKAKKPQKLKHNVFYKAFPKEILCYKTNEMYERESEKPDTAWLYTDYNYHVAFSDNDDDCNKGNITFWQWNPQANILIKATLENRVEALRKTERLLTRHLSGKSTFAFRGIGVEVGNKDRHAQYEWDKTNTPWCDTETYIMGGDAKRLLAINRETLLQTLNPDESDVPQMLKDVKATLRIGFEHLLKYIAVNKGKPKVQSYFKANSDACIPLALAAHCLYMKTIDAPPIKPDANDPSIVISKKSAYYFKMAFDFLVDMLKDAGNKHFVEVLDYDRVTGQAYGYRDITVWEMFKQLDKLWFVSSYPANMSLGAFTPEKIKKADIVTICEDLFAEPLFQMYWSDVFYIGTEVTPVYKYCAVASKGFCKVKDVLFRASYEYGKLQANMSSVKKTKGSWKQHKNNESEKQRLDRLKRLFGDRHVFPSIAEYEDICIPHDSKMCPESLSDSGYVLISPFTKKLFKKGVIREIAKQLDSIHEKEERRAIVWKALYPGEEKKEDIYGIYKLIMYVREKNGNQKPLGEYKQKYVDFVLDYIDIVFGKASQ